MAGLPKLPGYGFSDPTLTTFQKAQSFEYVNGYGLPKNNFCGVGGRELNSNSVKFLAKRDTARFDPSLMYGRTKSVALPPFTPHFALYDQKCLTFKAFFKQTVVESALEHYRVRIVNIIYFLENDTITVIEPRTPNSGIDQGRLIRRAKIPKTEAGDVYHWKDFAVGKDIAFFGIVYHIVDCDSFTREFMASQGLLMTEPEALPFDPYTQNRLMSVKQQFTKTPQQDDKLRRFLEYDGKILKFNAVLDDRDSEYGELRKYDVLYFLADDTITVKEIHDKNDGRDPFPILLKKIKLPKIYTDRPITFPSIYLELSDNEVSEYYQPRDLNVGSTIFVLGRKLLLFDCDKFTREYYRKALCINQNDPIDVTIKPKPPPAKQVPPHDGIGSLEDSLQNTLTFIPKPPRKDVLRQIQNANKYLRYEMVMDAVHPEDTIRRFLLLYSLADSTCKIHEPPIKNSGVLGGKYLKSSLLVKPGSDPLNPDYYSPSDFYIGAKITVFQQRFIITGADLYVYRYIQANPSKVPCEVMENIRNYMFTKGYLNEDIQDRLQDTLEKEKKLQRDSIGKELDRTKDEMHQCLERVKAGGTDDPEYEKRVRADILQQYEDSLKHTFVVPPHGIQDVNKVCPYPIEIGDIQSNECKDDPEGGISSYTPKHILTEEEKINKYYSDVLKKQHDICGDAKYKPECVSPKEDVYEDPKKPSPIMITPVDVPKESCKVKSVKFADVHDRCMRDTNDLCNLKANIDHSDCVDYKKCT